MGMGSLCQIFNSIKMKKIYVIVLTVFLNLAFFSCTPEALEDQVLNTEQATDSDDETPCCDEDGDIDPPPPGDGE